MAGPGAVWREALAYGLVLCAVFVLCAGLARAGPNLLGMEFAPLPVAVYAARRRFVRAGGVMACAAAAVWLSVGSVKAAAFCGLGAGIGLPVGIGIARRDSYGRIVAGVTALAFGIVALFALTSWQAWNAHLADAIRTYATEVEQAAPGPLADREAAQLELWRWLAEHALDVGLGSMFSTLLVLVCLGVSVSSWWVRRRYNMAGPQGSFRQMRPPDWLVWPAIATAVLWFADRQWPGTPVRAISWNSAVGLASVYWLNGVSILAYTVHALRSYALVYFVAVLVLVYLSPVLLFAGLFDTWTEFRRRLDGLLAARRAGDGPGGDEKP